jgi:hypothetical protein
MACCNVVNNLTVMLCPFIDFITTIALWRSEIPKNVSEPWAPGTQPYASRVIMNSIWPVFGKALSRKSEGILYIEEAGADIRRRVIFHIQGLTSVDFMLGLILGPADGGDIFLQNCEPSRTTRCHKPEDRTLHSDRRENLKSSCYVIIHKWSSP